MPQSLIERAASRCRITILTARPGMVIGRKGAEIDKLKEELSRMTGKEIYVDIVEIKQPEIDAQLVAENVALQLERRVSFRRAMKKALQTAQGFWRRRHQDSLRRAPGRRGTGARGAISLGPGAACTRCVRILITDLPKPTPSMASWASSAGFAKARTSRRRRNRRRWPSPKRCR